MDRGGAFCAIAEGLLGGSGLWCFENQYFPISLSLRGTHHFFSQNSSVCLWKPRMHPVSSTVIPVPILFPPTLSLYLYFPFPLWEEWRIGSIFVIHQVELGADSCGSVNHNSLLPETCAQGGQAGIQDLATTWRWMGTPRPPHLPSSPGGKPLAAPLRGGPAGDSPLPPKIMSVGVSFNMYQSCELQSPRPKFSRKVLKSKHLFKEEIA